MPGETARGEAARKAAAHARKLHAAEHAHHLGEAAALHALHHVLRLFKLFEQTVDLLHRYARTGGDAIFCGSL